MALPGWLTPEDLREVLANAGGAGSRTAATLENPALVRNLASALSEVAGRLFQFTLPPDDATLNADPATVPGLLLDVLYGIAGYTATLEFFGSQPLEDRDPVVLRYQRAQSLLTQIAGGKLVVPGITEGTPGQAGGEPAVYDNTPYLGIAEGWARDEERIAGTVSGGSPYQLGGGSW